MLLGDAEVAAPTAAFEVRLSREMRLFDIVMIGVGAILVAMATLAVPVLWKIGSEPHAATPPAATRMMLEQQTDGTWADAAGARYRVQRLDGD